MKEIIHASPDLLAALGSMSDFKVAAAFGVRPYQVRDLRLLHHIPNVHAAISRSNFEWTPEADALLGTMPDTQLASLLGTSRAIVNSRRTLLKILAFVPPTFELLRKSSQRHPWSPEEDLLLGTDFDNIIADKLNLNHLQVTHRRYQLGVDPFRRSATIQWTEQMLDNLGEISDKDFAEYFEICVASVYLKRLLLSIPALNAIDPPSPPSIPTAVIDLLGIKADVELAKMFEISRWSIRVNRLLRGLAPAPQLPRANQIKWTAEQEAMLGTMSDRNLGNMIGVSSSSVKLRRELLQIKPYIPIQEPKWNALTLGALGRSEDRALAQIWHCEVAAVKHQRESLQIAEHHGPRRWLASELALLGTLSDPQTGKLIGISPAAVRNKRIEMKIKPLLSGKKFRWTKKRLALLGTMADERLAYRLKVTPNVISKQRIQLNIPVWTGHRGSWANPEAVAKLGTMPDPALAKLLGITASAVFYKRKMMGIPPCLTTRVSIET
ncbi:hypothetical protein [Shewanella sp. CG12_big_fil_rev_8_21_14_0_65_47_15]|uniref:hypothetical protein n=1 Tax=Shewanella sp. CG12_big_fil_rev_8_21_14_0_65_47_15 TaxID=1975537 RepID=UPI000CB3D88E|nr:hypothetical protein [Shewanella sp. CG12_big_fil_rev_8_21_14_0_65_47_15]PIW60829.1 MAG: hypothetical protein COW15_11280 [Shewanella sp. CG12_big_fil_rev_8_21_14_0_65_47_15]